MHGGDIYRNKVNIDLSVNVNPLGCPDEVKRAIEESIDNIDKYPDIKCEKLKDGLAKKFKLLPENVVCGNGASELIMAIVHAKKPKKALLPVPCYLGYARALKAEGCEIDYCELEEFIPSITKGKYDMVFFSNPSNPMGLLVNKIYIKDVIAACKKNNTYLVVDECFIMLTTQGQSNSSVEYLSDYDKLFVLRAFTKSFALPGIRLGYVLCSYSEASELEKQLPEWNVSCIAQAAGVAALEVGDEFLRESALYIEQQRKVLKLKLEGMGYKTLRSDANFILFYSENENLYEEYLSQGILIRDCRDYMGLGPGFYRMAVQ